ncbi:hypothetical protein EJP57_25550, partial [Escherichia coli]|nr:hypothetical protein [Escherichia coli]
MIAIFCHWFFEVIMVRYHGEFTYYLYQQSGRYFFCKKLTKKRDTSNCNHLHIIRELSFNEDELELIDFSTVGLSENDKEIIRNMINE